SIQVARSLKDREAPIACLEGLAAVSAEQGEALWAAQLWGTIERLYQFADMQPSQFVLDTRKPLVKIARDQLGEQIFASAWAEGQKMTPEQTLAIQSNEKNGQIYAELTKREIDVLEQLAQGLTK